MIAIAIVGSLSVYALLAFWYRRQRAKVLSSVKTESV